MKDKKYGELQAYLRRALAADNRRRSKSPRFWIAATINVSLVLASIYSLFVIPSGFIFIWLMIVAFGYWIGREYQKETTDGDWRDIVRAIGGKLRRGELESAFGIEVAVEMDRSAANAQRVLAYFEAEAEAGRPGQPTPEERRQVCTAVHEEMDAMFALVAPAAKSGITPNLKTMAAVFAIGDNLDRLVSAVESYESAKSHGREERMLFEALKEVKLRIAQAKLDPRA